MKHRYEISPKLPIFNGDRPEDTDKVSYSPDFPVSVDLEMVYEFVMRAFSASHILMEIHKLVNSLYDHESLRSGNLFPSLLLAGVWIVT